MKKYQSTCKAYIPVHSSKSYHFSVRLNFHWHSTINAFDLVNYCQNTWEVCIALPENISSSYHQLSYHIAQRTGDVNIAWLKRAYWKFFMPLILQLIKLKTSVIVRLKIGRCTSMSVLGFTARTVVVEIAATQASVCKRNGLTAWNMWYLNSNHLAE